jgi:hypothetical protein
MALGTSGGSDETKTLVTEEYIDFSETTIYCFQLCM